MNLIKNSKYPKFKNIYKRLFSNTKYQAFIDSYPKIRIGAVLVAILCAFLIVIATFTKLPMYILTIPTEAFSNPPLFFKNLKDINEITTMYYYIPQIPLVIFAGALLGPRLGLFAVLLYISAGLFGCQVFASGGGLEYIKQNGFGYILGYILGVTLVGHCLNGVKFNLKQYMIASLTGVLAIHLVGILYLIGMIIINTQNILELFGWIWALSGIQLPYDLLLSFIAISIVIPVRGALWFAMD